jgi:hypothetical protein
MPPPDSGKYDVQTTGKPPAISSHSYLSRSISSALAESAIIIEAMRLDQ